MSDLREPLIMRDDVIDRTYRNLYGEGPMDADLRKHIVNTLVAAIDAANALMASHLEGSGGS